MKIKTSELTGAALDWAVAAALCKAAGTRPSSPWAAPYSTDWSQGGPIIDREGISTSAPSDGVVKRFFRGKPAWTAFRSKNAFDEVGIGPTPLVAAMRCFVASKLGDEVDVPEELL